MKACKWAAFALLALSAMLPAAAVYGHGSHPGHIDEGPGPGTAITIIMVVSWIVLALGVVFFVLRLIRPKDKDR
ncbi:MAG: hypothetical protein M1497_10395 [Nitrospirae bacterium]|nr:hypothetical protein [Nitrospirota bacterium]